ncbi:lipopolysaccharide heptosyltransferase I [Paludibacterium yongneupense]|uniref:lipopolysaccharide heptosyltransferase I n=2 Tax=Paludibacterium yongneupense TaxID=400061 RepID=UPI00048BC483|nr:lipopolysaccharide heptosyltransferase I [Paludibacterium yongneupense]
MMNVLIVRTSSMGDLIHTLPAVTELKTHYPNIQLSWLAEENFADIPRLHPAIASVLVFPWRRWRKSLLSTRNWSEMRALRASLTGTDWDLVIDAQGLLKSAIPARLSHAPLAGYDWHSAREPIASLFYNRRCRIDRALPAVERNRRLFGKVFGYEVSGLPCFGIAAGARPEWAPSGPYTVFLHATSRASKLWPETHWIELGHRLSQDGELCLPWGNEDERERAQRLAAALPRAIVTPRMSLCQAAGLLGHARAVVGVDTGLTHLANALDVPLAAIYTDTDPELTGVVETRRAANLGRAGACPGVDEVLVSLKAHGGME